MTKEAPNSPYPKLIKRITFRDEATVRRNGGNPTNVDFRNGVGSFNGSTSKVNYNLNLNGTYSVRIRCNPTSLALNQVIIDFRGSASGIGYIQTTNSGQLLSASSGTKYINGIGSTELIVGKNNEIIITGMTLKNLGNTVIGNNYVNSAPILTSIDLVEIYQGTLTASEVANLYNNTWNKELSPNNLLLDFDSTSGVIKDRTGLNTLTPTDVSIKKIGQSYSADFNGTTSKIDTGSDFIGTKAVTVMAWIKPYSYGEKNIGAILYNEKTIFRLTSSAPNGLQMFSDGYSSCLSSANSISLNKYQFVAVTRKSTGVVNFYIGDKSTAPALSGTADQTIGTPTAGTTNVIIGNNSGATRTFDGNISELKCFENILSIEDITNIWSSTRKNYI